jgi:hypothetical protein
MQKVTGSTPVISTEFNIDNAKRLQIADMQVFLFSALGNYSTILKMIRNSVSQKIGNK